MKSWSLPQQSKCIIFSDEKILYSYFLEKSPNKHTQKKPNNSKSPNQQNKPHKIYVPYKHLYMTNLLHWG